MNKFVVWMLKFGYLLDCKPTAVGLGYSAVYVIRFYLLFVFSVIRLYLLLLCICYSFLSVSRLYLLFVYICYSLVSAMPISAAYRSPRKVRQSSPEVLTTTMRCYFLRIALTLVAITTSLVSSEEEHCMLLCDRMKMPGPKIPYSLFQCDDGQV